MPLIIEMHDPQGTILDELVDGKVTQSSVAITYAFVIAQLGNAADWPRINRAIMARWKGKAALERIKKAAWRQVQKWGYRAQARQG